MTAPATVPTMTIPADGVPAAAVAAAAETVAASTIEPKVTAATAASAGSAAVILPAVLWLLAQVTHAPVAPQVSALLGLLVTGGCTFAAGYRARHVNRA